MQHPYTQPVATVVETLDSSLDNGLTVPDALERLATHGKNELIDKASKSLFLILADQFKSLLVMLLVVAAVVSGAVLGEWTDAAVIAGIVILNALLGFRQEFKAEKAMAALKKLSTPLVRVRRGGDVMEIESTELVPGDVVYLEAGNVVPADGRLLESAALQIEEASLTGESVPVTKHTNPIADPETPLGDRKNMAYMGTVVTYGRGLLAVTDTGMDTELGKIAERLQTVEKQDTPLQKQLARLGRFLVLAALGLIAVVAVVGVVQGEALKTVFLTAVSMAVAAVPEGLPAAVTIALAVGAQRMLRRNALIRKLPAVETLGAVTTICSDKTGTLTQNRMTVTLLSLPGHPDIAPETSTCDPKSVTAPAFFEECPASELLLSAAALCTDAELTHAETVKGETLAAVGDPTEGALVIAAARHARPKTDLAKALRRVAEAPFDSDRKRMTTVHALFADPAVLSKNLSTEIAALCKQAGAQREDSDSKYASSPSDSHLVCSHLAFVKGATAAILECADRIWEHGALTALDAETKQRWEAKNDALAADGIRVLAVACRPDMDPAISDPEANPEAADLESELVFLGLVGMIDPVRPEAVQAVAKCTTAGIRTVMITGDHPLMARHIARDLHMIPRQDDAETRILTGRELAQMSEKQLMAEVENVSVYARVAPEHKLNIVRALQEQGHICSMTGDGVNDAPALKTADIGVAMGITGTDVSKEASDMVLRDDNFATIVSAVEEGRTIFGNIRRFVRYLLACNTGELWLFLMAPLLGMPLPLLPVQILWMNLVTDGFPALGLGIEPPERDIMMRPPRNPEAAMIGWSQTIHILWVGLVIAGGAMAMAYFQWLDAGAPTGAGHGDAIQASTWQTMLFSAMVFSQLFLSFAERADRASLFQIGIATNLHMLFAVAATFLLQLGVIYLPPAQKLFGTTALSLSQLGVCVAIGTVVFVAVELEKSIKRLRPIKHA